MKTFQLEVYSVVYQVGTHKVLSDVYLQCNTGKIIGLLGRNGSGKSTLLKVIFGTLDTPNKNIRINRVPYSKPHFGKSLISYLPQNSFLPKHFKVKQIIRLYYTDIATQKLLFKHAHVAPFLNQKIGTLSGGERRYIETLLLLHLPAPFLLLDEPFEGIAPIHKEKICELLLTHKPSKGIIITDHDYQSILSLSDEVLLMKQGVVKKVDSTSELETLGYLPEGSGRKRAYW